MFQKILNWYKSTWNLRWCSSHLLIHRIPPRYFLPRRILNFVITDNAAVIIQGLVRDYHFQKIGDGSIDKCRVNFATYKSSVLIRIQAHLCRGNCSGEYIPKIYYGLLEHMNRVLPQQETVLLRYKLGLYTLIWAFFSFLVQNLSVKKQRDLSKNIFQ